MNWAPCAAASWARCSCFWIIDSLSPVQLAWTSAPRTVRGILASPHSRAGSGCSERREGTPRGGRRAGSPRSRCFDERRHGRRRLSRDEMCRCARSGGAERGSSTLRRRILSAEPDRTARSKKRRLRDDERCLQGQTGPRKAGFVASHPTIHAPLTSRAIVEQLSSTATRRQPTATPRRGFAAASAGPHRALGAAPRRRTRHPRPPGLSRAGPRGGGACSTR